MLTYFDSHCERSEAILLITREELLRRPETSWLLAMTRARGLIQQRFYDRFSSVIYKFPKYIYSVVDKTFLLW
jgi:hypothetical protein